MIDQQFLRGDEGVSDGGSLKHRGGVAHLLDTLGKFVRIPIGDKPDFVSDPAMQRVGIDFGGSRELPDVVAERRQLVTELERAVLFWQSVDDDARKRVEAFFLEQFFRTEQDGLDIDLERLEQGGSDGRRLGLLGFLHDLGK